MTVRHFLTGIILTMQLALPTAALAQQNVAPVERLTVTTGDVVEILPVQTIAHPRFAWILTQDRTFLEAGQTPLFRTRLVQSGQYTLTLDVIDEDTGERIRAVLLLDVHARGDQATDAAAPDVQRIITTVPMADSQERIVLPSTSATVRLTPLPQTTPPLIIDTDATVDANDDGDPTNDPAVDGAFFSTNRTPLILWFLEGVANRDIVVTSGNEQRRITVLTEQYARANGILTGEARIITSEIEPGITTFSLRFTGVQPEVPLLLRWEFGDNQQSLENTPTHRYLNGGDYDVQVTVSNVISGEQIARAQTTVTVQDPTPIVSSASSTPGGSPTPTPEPSTGGGWSRWLLLIGFFFASLLLGLGILALLSRIRRRIPKIPEAVEAIEKKVMGNEQATENMDEQDRTEATTETPEPKGMHADVLSATTIPEDAEPPVAEHPASETPPQPSEHIDPSKAPAWLMQGLEKGDDGAKTTGEQPPNPPQPTVSFSAPEEKPWTPKPQAPADEPLPEWLAPSSSAQSTAVAAQEAAPEPQMPEPVPPTPPPPPADEPLPEWQAPESAAQSVAPASPSADLPVLEDASPIVHFPEPVPPSSDGPVPPVSPTTAPTPPTDDEKPIGRPGEVLPGRLSGKPPAQPGPTPVAQDIPPADNTIGILHVDSLEDGKAPDLPIRPENDTKPPEGTV